MLHFLMRLLRNSQSAPAMLSPALIAFFTSARRTFSHLSCSVKKNLQKVFAWGTSGVGLLWGRNGVEGGGYRRSVTPEARDVAGVVIWHAVVPAAECDADPLEC